MNIRIPQGPARHFRPIQLVPDEVFFVRWDDFDFGADASSDMQYASGNADHPFELGTKRHDPFDVVFEVDARVFEAFVFAIVLKVYAGSEFFRCDAALPPRPGYSRSPCEGRKFLFS